MKTLKQEVDTVEEKTFSSPQIQRFIPNSKWILYSSLKNISNLKLFMRGKRNLLILIDPPNSRIGHFVLLILKSHNEAIFFDPYGNSLQKLLRILDLPDFLPRLLKSYRVISNINQFEVLKPKIQTCGRWCVIRGIFSNMSNLEFSKFMKFKNVKSDELAVLLTYCFLN